MGEAGNKELSNENLIPSEQATYLYKKHIRGAYARTGGALLVFLFIFIGWRLGTYDSQALFGISISALYLILLNPPTLWILKRIRKRKSYTAFSIFINFLEICGFTAGVYFGGGLRASYLTLIYAGVISYVGVAAPRRTIFLIGMFCMISFDLMAVIEHLGFIPHQNSVWPYNFQWQDVITICLLINVLFGVVAFMALSTGTRLRMHRNNLREKNLELDRSRQELASAKEEVEARVEELDVINHVSMIVNRSLDLKDNLQSVCEELCRIFPVRSAIIALSDSDINSLEIVAFHAVDPKEEKLAGQKMSLEMFPSSAPNIEDQEPVLIHDAQTDQKTAPMHGYFKSLGIRSLLIAPLLVRSKAIGIIGMPAEDPSYEFTKNEIELLQTLSHQIATGVDNAKLYAQTELALDRAEHELEIGRQIQSGFLPDIMPLTPGWEISSYFEGARQVAGDFYDAFPLGVSGNIGLVIGDVCDKGVGAALFMVVFTSLIRAFSEAQHGITDCKKILMSIVPNINNFIARTHDSSNMFATVFFGILEPSTDTLHYINAGHEQPRLVDAKGKIKAVLETTGPAIGLMPDMEFNAEHVIFKPGDILVAYTDGVVDARNSQGKSFTEKSLISNISKPFTSAFSLLKSLEFQIDIHIEKAIQFDDITMIALRRKNSLDDEKHEFSLEATLKNLSILRRFIEHACIHMRLDEKMTSAFKLAVDEACTNIVTHGYKGQDPGPIKLTFEREPDNVKLSIYDEGRTFDPDDTKAADIESDWEERRIGGLGLFLIKEVMDDVHYESEPAKGNRLILIKKLNVK